MRPHILLIQIFLTFSVLSAQQTPLHHSIKVSVNPKTSELQVMDHITFPEGFFEGEINFLLNENLAVGVQQGKAVIEQLDTGQAAIDIGMDRDLEEGYIRSKNKRYRVLFPPGVLKSDSISLKYSGRINYQVSSSGPEYARSFSQSPGIIGEEGIYLAGSSFWVPYFDERLFTFDMEVSLPTGWSSVSQGKRTNAADQGGRHQDHWEFPHPTEEVFLIGAPFTEYSFSAGSVTAMAFLRTPDEALASKYLETTAQYLEMYRKLIGPFPFTKFALVENFWETGYGMPSFTLLGPRVIRFPFILHSSYPHELLHNWWGNSVYVDFDGGNWCEGLTAYMADHLISEQRGQGSDYRRATLQKFADYVDSSNDFPISRFRSRNSAATEAIGYGKTLMVFHMLRQRFGDDIFQKAFQEFYREYRFKRASFSDIREIFEKFTEEDLKPFFWQWIGEQGAPEIEIESAEVEQTGEGFLVNLILKQKSKRAYQLEIPVAVYTSDGANTRSVQITEAQTRIQLQSPSEPLKLVVDPEFDVFRRLDPFETPPSLSKAFGADQVLILLPSLADAAALQEYRKLAETWSAEEKEKFVIAMDQEIEDLPANKAIWVLGKENLKAALFSEGLSQYGVKTGPDAIDFKTSKFSFQNYSIITSIRHPQNPDSVVVWLSFDRPAAVPGLARKLPHYGKYSYLAFIGDEPENIFKGEWPAVNSPLVHVFKDSTSGLPELPKRNALAVLPPVFSGERMMETVRFLSSEELRGRGIDQPEIDKAADFIREQFTESGLLPGGDNGSYYQSFEYAVGRAGENRKLHNVIGVLPGTNEAYKGQSVVVSAHYDHLGLGWPDAYQGSQGKIHHGADDNASGVAVLLELARTLGKSMKPDRTVIFAAFTAEEAGLLGSRHYVAQSGLYPVEKVIANLNLDTVGRLGDRKLLILNGNSAREWRFIFMGTGYVTGVESELVMQQLDASDQTAFIEKGIPAVQFFSGPHSDYHRPTDTADKIDPDGLVKVATVLKETVEYLAARPEPMAFSGESGSGADQTRSSVSDSGGRRVSTGIMPNFSFSGKGVKIESVGEGSPAQKAGISPGDILISFGGVAIESLRQYASELQKYQPGDQVSVVVMRGGKEVLADLILAAR